MEGLELICFNIISSVGMAKSSYVEAMRAAAKGDYEESAAKMKEGTATIPRATTPIWSCCQTRPTVRS